MSHHRADSAMTHSSRQSYKDKLNKLRADRAFDVERATEILQVQAEANSSFLDLQDELHTLSKRVATTALSGIKLLDDLSFCEGLKFPAQSKQIDNSLTNMNISIMLRRSDDIIKKLMERVGILSEAYNETKQGLDQILTQATLLQTPLAQIKDKAFETSIIGQSATFDEKQQAEEQGEFNRFGLSYETDTDNEDSDTESETNSTSGAYALALRN